MSIVFLLEWPCELRRKMIERQFDWKRLRLLHAAGLLASVVLSLGMAWAGCGAYALLIPGMVVTIPFIIDLFWRLKWRPTWSWSWAAYGSAFSFGISRNFSGAFVLGRTFVESATLAAVLGFGTLGVANRAMGLGQMFCIKVSAQLLYAIYPILARIDNTNTSRANSIVLRVVSWTTLPVAFLFASLATPIVETIYGSQWLEVVELIPAAMFWATVSAGNHAAYMMLLARSRQRLCLLVDMIQFAGVLVSLNWALPFGLPFYFLAIALVSLFGLLIVLAALVRFEALRISGILSAFLPSLIASLIAWTLAEIVLARAEAGFAVASLVGALYGVVFVAALRILFPRPLRELIDYLPFKKHFRKALFLPPDE